MTKIKEKKIKEKKIKEKPIKEFLDARKTNLAPNIGQASTFYKLPTSNATHGVLKVLTSGKDNLATLGKRAKTINPNQQIEVLQNGKKRLIRETNYTSTVEIELADIEKLTGSNKPAKKLFMFNLIKMNEQAYNRGTLKRNYIQFSLQELIDIGFYSSLRSARTGFNSGMDILTSLKVKGSMKKGKKEITTALEVLFTGANIKNGVCTVFLNERINWAFIASFYTILPQYSFKLTNKAFDLTLYVFYLARQNIKQIKEKGYFTISLRAIQNQLVLPNELDCINPTRDIKKPIADAITEILHYEQEFNIEIMSDNNAPIATYLNNGYIKIYFNKNHAKYFIDLYENNKKRIETTKKKREKIIEKAITKKIKNNT